MQSSPISVNSRCPGMKARFFGRMGETLSAYNQTRREITQILDTSVLPIDVTDNKTLVYVAAVLMLRKPGRKSAIHSRYPPVKLV